MFDQNVCVCTFKRGRVATRCYTVIHTNIPRHYFLYIAGDLLPNMGGLLVLASHDNENTLITTIKYHPLRPIFTRVPFMDLNPPQFRVLSDSLATATSWLRTLLLDKLCVLWMLLWLKFLDLPPDISWLHPHLENSGCSCFTALEGRRRELIGANHQSGNGSNTTKDGCTMARKSA